MAATYIHLQQMFKVPTIRLQALLSSADYCTNIRVHGVRCDSGTRLLNFFPQSPQYRRFTSIGVYRILQGPPDKEGYVSERERHSALPLLPIY
jgi:hypothetical protein